MRSFVKGQVACGPSYRCMVYLCSQVYKRRADSAATMAAGEKPHIRSIALHI